MYAGICLDFWFGLAAKQLDPVHNELKQLNIGLRSVQEEHAFLMDREKKHRDGNPI